MVSFLAPWALLGLSLLAIPIIVHLLKPRKVRRTPFSSLRWLHVTQQRLSRRIRWHQVLLFLLRATFIVLLVLLVARPLFHRGATGKASERFVVLDVSRSMSYRNAEQPTPLELGKQAAEAILASGQSDDRTALLATGATTRVLSPLARSGEVNVSALGALEVEPTDTDLGSALDVIRTMLAQRRTDAGIDLFIITDNHQGTWRPGAIESFLAEFPDQVQSTIVNAADPLAQNAWIADARLTADDSDAPPSLTAQLRCVGNAQERTARMIGAGLEERSQKVTLRPGQPTSISFELPADFERHAKTAEIVLEPADGLPSDDRWFVALDAAPSLRVLLVEGRGANESASPPGFALQTAIESLSSSAQKIALAVKKASDVQPADFGDADVVLWADVPELSDAAVESLTDRVRQGLGFAAFLGPNVQPDFYNSKLFDSLDRSRGLLPARLDQVVEIPRSQGGLAALESVAWNHPLLAGLFDPALGDLAQVQIQSYYRLSAPRGDVGTVLAAANGSPVIVEHAVGAGKVMLFTVTADDLWSDLPRRKSFVPLADQLLKFLSGGMAQRTFLAAESVTLVVPQLAPGATVSVVGPDNAVTSPTIGAAGNRTLLRLPGQKTAGVYHVRQSGNDAAETMFIVQTGRGDSAIEPLDADVFRARWQPAECEIVRVGDVAERFAADGGNIPLAVWLAILAAAVFMTEMFLVHWLCPRMNPELTTSIIQSRRLVVAPANPQPA